MASWEIFSTDHFLNDLKKIKNNRSLLDELDKRIIALKENPDIVGSYLHGNLHPSKSVRVHGKYRLIFQVVHKEKKVYLEAIDHRKDVYG